MMSPEADEARVRAGGLHFEWQGDLDCYFGVMRRDGDGSDIRWFRAPNAFLAHTLNAFEEDGLIHIDMPAATGNVFTFFPEADGSVPPPGSISSALVRFSFDLSSNSEEAIRSTLYDAPCEFPRVDDRVAGRKHRHAFLLGLDMRHYSFEKLGPPPFQFFNQLVHLDLETGEREVFAGSDADCFQEPIFVPRSNDAPEGDGYVMALQCHLEEATTELLILNSLKLGDGPVARIKMPMRLRMALHGNWIPAAKQH